MSKKHRVRLKTRVRDGEELDSLASSLWQGANWSERECFDMFGIRFRGHPDLRRILHVRQSSSAIRCARTTRSRRRSRWCSTATCRRPSSRRSATTGQPVRAHRLAGAAARRQPAGLARDRGATGQRPALSAAERRPDAGASRSGEVTMEPIEQYDDESALELPAEPMRLNMGPSHPAMHGTDPHRARPRRRDDREARRPARLPAPRLREDAASAAPGRRSSRTRPAQLRLADAQQRRLRARGREDARHRGAGALPVCTA